MPVGAGARSCGGELPTSSHPARPLLWAELEKRLPFRPGSPTQELKSSAGGACKKLGAQATPPAPLNPTGGGLEMWGLGMATLCRSVTGRPVHLGPAGGAGQAGGPRPWC